MSVPFPAGLGPRLRHERERRKITLASIAENTKISVALLEGLEKGDVSKWPSGIFRRSFVKAYADAVGLDPESTLREFLEQYPDPAEAPPPVEAVAPPPAADRWVAVRGLRVRIADAGAAFMRGSLLPDVPRRWAAAVCDLAVIVSISLLLFVVLQQFWMPFAVVTLGYYIGSIVLLGNTPGVTLFAPDSRHEHS